MKSVSEKFGLSDLTGLTDTELADVLSKNPRAYMAVKGAVAEKHLEKILEYMKKKREIKDFKRSSNDFDKDFQVVLKNKKEISLECKNIQVLNTNNKTLGISYINFLVSQNYYDHSKILSHLKRMNVNFGSYSDPKSLKGLLQTQSSRIVRNLIKCFPQEIRESGIPRYEFSASLVDTNDAYKMLSSKFLHQFDQNPLTIDFQRTRNSTTDDGDNRKQRFYSLEEIDVVGACLFSRTMKWQFIFGQSKFFNLHTKYTDRYSNRLEINPEKWHASLIECLELGQSKT